MKEEQKLKCSDDCREDIVTYAPYCDRGDVIALLYNNAIREKSGEISPEMAEKLVHKQLGDAIAMDGRIIPRKEGFIGTINGVVLNVYCYAGAIDVSEYPPRDGKTLIYDYISKCRCGLDSINARLNPWETVN